MPMQLNTWSLQPSPLGIGVHQLMLNNGPQRQLQSYPVMQRVRPSICRITAEDHLDRIGSQWQESPSLVAPIASQSKIRLVSALLTIFISLAFHQNPQVNIPGTLWPPRKSGIVPKCENQPLQDHINKRTVETHHTVNKINLCKTT